MRRGKNLNKEALMGKKRERNRTGEVKKEAEDRQVVNTHQDTHTPRHKAFPSFRTLAREIIFLAGSEGGHALTLDSEWTAVDQIRQREDN